MNLKRLAHCSAVHAETYPAMNVSRTQRKPCASTHLTLDVALCAETITYSEPEPLPKWMQQGSDGVEVSGPSRATVCFSLRI